MKRPHGWNRSKRARREQQILDPICRGLGDEAIASRQDDGFPLTQLGNESYITGMNASLFAQNGGPSQRDASIAQALEHPVTAQKTTDIADKRRSSIKEAIGKLVGDPAVEPGERSQQKLPRPDAKPKTTSEP